VKGEKGEAATIGAESITTADLEKGGVMSAKIAAEAVETGKIKLLAVTEALLGAEAVAEAKIKKEAVSESKLKGEAVAESKLKKEAVTVSRLSLPSAKPAKPAEGAVSIGSGSPARKISAAIVGNGVKKEWGIEHNLETRLVEVIVQTSEGEEPAEVESAANYKVKAISAKSIEVVFTTAPAAKSLLYITVVG
jgi:hypothetical protein